MRSFFIAILMLGTALTAAHAQGNYEIQVYGADTVAPRNTMLELHSNFTADGQPRTSAASRPPTMPSTRPSKSPRASMAGLRSASTSSRLCRAARASSGSATTSAPVCACRRSGAGQSASASPPRLAISAPSSPDTWTWEIRPILDKQTGRWYFAVNPALERTWHGPDVNLGLGFAPAAKISYDFTRKITGGLEYYADYGSITNIASLHNQQQQLFPAIDLNVSPDWEINFGVGIGPTAATDHWIVKAILGRRFNWSKNANNPAPVKTMTVQSPRAVTDQFSMSECVITHHAENPLREMCVSNIHSQPFGVFNRKEGRS